MLHITCHPGTEGGDGGGKTRTPLFLRGTTDCILVSIPGTHHVACPHRYLCKLPHDIPVRLVVTAYHDFILPDVERAFFHAEVKLSNGSMHVGLRASYGPHRSAYQNRPCATLIQINSGAPLLTRSAWMPARCCSHQTTITKSAAPSHSLPHVLRRHWLHQADCTLSRLLVGAEGLAVVELQMNL